MTVLSERFAQAVAYALDLHRNQERKGSRVPYAAHVLGVASLVLEHAGDEDEAIAALLHDSVEDQGGERRLAEVRALFGERIADIVLGCTDTVADPKPPWRERKERYVAHLRGASASVRLVTAADKLYNARCIALDYRIVGEELWSRFTGGRAGVLWYYRALCDALTQPDTVGRMALVAELDRTVGEIVTLASECGTSDSLRGADGGAPNDA